MEIIWTAKAKQTFYSNVSYLENYWTAEIADNFIKESLRVIEIIKKNPHIGRYDEDYQCNVILIVKQISLFYEVEKTNIILLNFWDNRQKPIKKLDI
jgi:plasmid stabilization system protein ParE